MMMMIIIIIGQNLLGVVKTKTKTTHSAVTGS